LGHLHQQNRCSLHSLILGLLISLYTLSACTSTQFQGRLPPSPEWVFTDLSKWDQRSLSNDGSVSIHGHGQSAQQTLISKRRALADADAVSNVKARYIELYTSFLAATPNRTQLVTIMNNLPWEQIVLTHERYFDAEKNRQHTLVSIQKNRLIDAINFERSMDNSKETDWNQVIESIRNFYKSLEFSKTP
jgi:hypothetical protein